MAKLQPDNAARKLRSRIRKLGVAPAKLGAREREWLEKHASDVDALSGAELPPSGSRSLDDERAQIGEQNIAGAPKKELPSIADVRKWRAYDEEMERFRDWELATPPPVPTREQSEQFAQLATGVVRRLGAYSFLKDLMPVASVPLTAQAPAVHPYVFRALPELQALHRALFPGWREMVRNWLMARAWQADEVIGSEVVRRSREHQARRGKPVTGLTKPMPERAVPSAAQLLSTIGGKPSEFAFDSEEGQIEPDPLEVAARQFESLTGPIPAGLSVDILEFLGARAIQRPGKKSGVTPEEGVKLAEEWAAIPNPRPAMLAWEDSRKARRGSRRTR